MRTTDIAASSHDHKVRDPLWDNLKLLAMICVIFRHSILQRQCLWYPYVWTPMMFAMPAFCFVSGRMFKQRTLADTAKRYLWPCLLFTILLQVWGQLFYPPLKGCLLPEAIIVGPAMWYLLALFVWQMVTPHVLRLNIWVVFALSMIAGCIAGFVPWIGVRFQLSRLICFYPYFILGIATKKFAPLSHHRKYCWIWGFAFCILCLTYYVLHLRYHGLVFQIVMNKGYPLSIKWPIIRLFTYFMGISMTICVIMILSSIGSARFAKYGSRTMGAYLLHMFVIMPICYTLANPHLYEPVGYFLTMVVAPLCCIPLFGENVNGILDIMLHPSFFGSGNRR